MEVLKKVWLQQDGTTAHILLRYQSIQDVDMEISHNLKSNGFVIDYGYLYISRHKKTCSIVKIMFITGKKSFGI